MHQGFRWLLVLSLLATFIVITPSAVQAATLTVTTTADSGAGSLRQAVLDASSGDTIAFNIEGDGPHTVTLTTGQITIDKNLTIAGPGAAQLTVARSSAVGTTNFRIFQIADGTTVTINGLTISNGLAISGTGEAISGGGILNGTNGTLNLISSTISGNAAAFGGGIFNLLGTVNLTSSTISGNSATSGGGIANAGTLTVTSSTISGNSATSGGGIATGTGMLTVTSSTISDNSATDSGGGIYNIEGTLTVISSTISGNSAVGGGGIHNIEGTLTVSSSTISGNSATDSGGGIATAGTVNLTSSTVSGNSATSGGGIANAGTVNLASSIVAGNTGGNVLGVVPSTTNSVIDGDPMLAPLADNGGPTQTMLPQPDSPAINALLTTCPAVDQRGVERPQGSACDIGAVEVRFPALDLPDDIVTTPTSPDGTPVEFEVTATDWEGDDTSVSCDADSGDLFEQGTTTVTCSTSGEVDHDVSRSFTVTVTLPDAPTITVPDDILVEATSSAGAVVTFSPAATDWNDSELTVTCDPASGSLFTLDEETTVTCSATDEFDRTAEDSFTVTVQDTTAPVLSQPVNLTVNATGPAGAIVTYDPPTVTDAVDENVTVTCEPSPGSLFPTGTTPVTCSASDAAGNDADPVSFSVTVLGGSGQLSVLINDVRTGPGSTLVKSRLLVLLQAADLSLRRGQTSQACTLLAGFATTVQLYGAVRLIPPATAAEWLADAIQIRKALGCR